MKGYPATGSLFFEIESKYIQRRDAEAQRFAEDLL